jgi:protein arginine N-methyltransferase 1
VRAATRAWPRIPAVRLTTPAPRRRPCPQLAAHRLLTAVAVRARRARARRIYLAPIRTPLLEERSSGLQHSLAEWGTFAAYMRDEHGIAVDCLDSAYADEHVNYFMRTSQWKSLAAEAVVGEACEWYSFDVNSVTIDELKRKALGPFSCAIKTAGPVHALAGWFDTTFDGSAQNPTDVVVTLSTAPQQGYTHWGQQVFLLAGQVFAERGDTLAGDARLTRQKANQRTLHFELEYALRRKREGAPAEHSRKITYQID